MAKKSTKMNGKRWLVLLVLAVVFVVLLVALLAQKEPGGTQPNVTRPQQTRPQQNVTRPQQTEPQVTIPKETEQIPVEIEDPDAVLLGDGLQIRDIGRYSGVYMEDGTDEIVSDVMMIILENNSAQDLQLARVEIEYPGFTAEFEATSLPYGEAVVLLEKNRHEMTTEAYVEIRTKNVVFFEEDMELATDLVEITGADGTLRVTNISAEEITGDFYIYYKNSAVDLLYGGITYRVRVDGGLASGETTTVIAGHYREGSSRILMTTGLE